MELINAKNRAEESNRLKSAFLANMSHEIRTPLNAIVGFSGILASTEEEEEKQEYVSIIENNNTLLLQLISDILDLSKIEAGTLDLHYSNVEINDLMKDLENMCQLKLKSDAVKLEFVAPEEPCFAHIEKNRLSQLIINLVTNAINSPFKVVSDLDTNVRTMNYISMWLIQVAAFLKISKKVFWTFRQIKFICTRYGFRTLNLPDTCRTHGR